jgi:ABC-type dipeptide/oligopeptide/nickel transport system permease component
MISYIIRRLLLIFPTLIGMTMIVFFTIGLAPGGIGGSLLSAEGNMRPAERAARREYLNKRYGLDKSLIVQYGHWLNNVSPIGFKAYDHFAKSTTQPDAAGIWVTGIGFPKRWPIGFKVPDLGFSYTHNQPASQLIRQRIPVTLSLELISLPVSYTVAILAGIAAARRRGKLVDVGLGTGMIGLYSVPTIWTGVLFICYFCNKQYFNWFPSNNLHDVLADSMNFLPTFSGGFHRGWLLDTIWHMVLPVICITYGNFAVLSKLTRASLLDSLSQDFVRTARAKGLAENAVVYRHAFPNSLTPLITVAAYILPNLIVGTLIAETLFGVRGMGLLTYDAIDSRDRELLLSSTLIISILTLISYLLADIGYAIADPRVSFEGES